jgi:tRNA(fMet)-specific endonuclease VapC
MLRYMLDTNLCIHVMRNPGSSVSDHFKAHAGELCISTITLHELIHGADRSKRPEFQRELTMDLASRLDVLEFDSVAADHSGNIHASLAMTGSVIGAYDMLIAGHARSRGLTVVTNNLREFERVGGLRCEDWL